MQDKTPSDTKRSKAQSDSVGGWRSVGWTGKPAVSRQEARRIGNQPAPTSKRKRG